MCHGSKEQRSEMSNMLAERLITFLNSANNTRNKMHFDMYTLPIVVNWKQNKKTNIPIQEAFLV